MGKANKGGGASSKKGGKGGKTAAASKKCTCDHPYTCTCGNRPERPSKGHKWDPELQAWGGKGHKQKGASGQQVQSKTPASQTTSIGKTTLQAWQRLPSTLLQEICQRQKRPRPKFKNIYNNKKDDSSSDLLFQYRCIVPDAKQSEKDLFFVPAQPVPNEEQAKEESALLALLHLTPQLPHERTLPEPYKSTWYTAIAAAASSKAKPDKNDKSDHASSNNNGNKNNKSAAAAQANTNLTMKSKFVSSADRKQQQLQKKQAQNAKIRHHEAVRMANRPPSVFLSAKLRQQIQAVLTGGNLVEEDDTEEKLEEDDAPRSDVQAYVEERLHSEGFTRRQARQAFATHTKETVSETEWEDLYDKCLQWLCLHLKEDELPEGFDPRGGTLEVLPAPRAQTTTMLASTSQASSLLSSELVDKLSAFGFTSHDVSNFSARVDTSELDLEKAVWQCLLEDSQSDWSSSPDAGLMSNEERHQIRADELEALQAMFPEDVSTEKNPTTGETTIALKIPDVDLTLRMVMTDMYPSELPKRIFLSGEWEHLIGVGTHLELIRYVADQPRGDPLMFSLYGHVQTLLQAPEELQSVQLRAKSPAESLNNKASTKANPGLTDEAAPENKKKTSRARPKRPRERAPFWRVPPLETPAATAFPKLDASIDRQRKSLPAAQVRHEFLTKLKLADQCGSRVVLVTGETGSGKTTQIPQFILEEFPEQVKIVVAQPRRLAAVGVATRVAQERGEAGPGRASVGYVVRGDSAYSEKTRLLFCTTGILLRQLQCEGALDAVTHVVIDEVHERHLDGDVLMALLKNLLISQPNLRVILMSATLEAERFERYWGSNTPRMHIPGRTFPVEDFFLEDVLDETNYVPPKKPRKNRRFAGNNSNRKPRKKTAWNDSEMSDDDDEEETYEEESPDPANDIQSDGPTTHNMPPLEERVKRIDPNIIDYDLLGQLVKSIIHRNVMGSDGSILVFLAGVDQINQAMQVIKKITRGMSVLLLPLHGGLQAKDQTAVFRSSGSSTKVILSTNVAETSITIPDCTVVIDTCREKQSSYDPSNRMPLLLEQFASKASLKQRRGRAGRVRSGICYKLISRSTYSGLNEHTAPEITRCALDQTLLSLLFLGVEDGSKRFLNSLLDPPDNAAIDAALESLSLLGAVHWNKAEKQVRLLPLGSHLAAIPAPPVVGKLLVMGTILGCRQAAVAMAAVMSTPRSIFLRIDAPPKHIKEESIDQAMAREKTQAILDRRQKVWDSVGGNSDHALGARILEDYLAVSPGGGQRQAFCSRLGLGFQTMKEVVQLMQQLDGALTAAGFATEKHHHKSTGPASGRLLRGIVVSALSPGHLVKVVRPSTKYQETAEGSVEKSGQAKELRFFTSDNNKERVFVHPSSFAFSTGNYACPWLVYHSMVRTSKPFLRDVTEASPYALLLWGGRLQVQARNSLIVVADQVELSANARIGALMNGLRQRLDALLEEKVVNPSLEIAATPEMKLMVQLLTTEGVGN